MRTSVTAPAATQWVAALLRDEEPFEHIPTELAHTLQLLCELLSPPHAALSALDERDCGTAINNLVAAGFSLNVMSVATNATLPLAARVALVRAIPSLFAAVIAKRLPAKELASSNRDPSQKSLANITLMFWDYAAITPDAKDESRREIDAACLDAMESVLHLDHVGCQEGALHGLSLWRAYPKRVRAILDRWLSAQTLAHPALQATALGLRNEVDRDTPR